MKAPSAPAAAETEHLDFMDGLRAVAVLAVLLSHDAYDGRPRPLWFDSGGPGVALFFAISGFCLAYPFLARWRKGQTVEIDARAYGRFLLRRFSRIAPPYYAALGLFALLALTPFGFPNAAGQDTRPPAAARDFLSYLAFLTGPSPIYNASFWTLGIEARWYLLCPLLLALYMRSRLGFCLVGGGLYFHYYTSPSSIADEGTLPAFMLGILAADLFLTDHVLRRVAWIPALGTVVLGVLYQALGGIPYISCPIWHVAGFFIVLAGSAGFGARAMRCKPLVWVGVCSYSIYLVHGPFIKTFIAKGGGLVASPLLALALCLTFYYAIERQVTRPAVRKRIETALSGLAPRPLHLAAEVTEG